MKRGSLIVLVCVSMVLLGMCSGNSSSQRSSASVVKIRIASDLADDAPKSVALYQFEKDVESASNNEIDVEVYTNNALGGELQYHDSIVDGSVEMVTAGTGFASRFHPYAAFDTPFLIASWEEAQKVFDSDYAQKVFDNMISGVGVRFLAFTPIGFRVFASVKEIDSMDDFSGMRCRAPAIPVYLKLIGNLGANPVAFPLGELFTALEQKACEALELPVGTISTNKYYEVAKYILDTKHMMTVQSLVVNEKFFQSLSEKHKEVVIDASKKLQKNCIDYYVEYEKSVLTEMASNGAIVNEPSADFMNKLRASQNNIIQIIEEEHLGAAQVVAGIGRILGR